MLYYSIITPQGYITTYNLCNSYIVEDPVDKPTIDGNYFYAKGKYYPVNHYADIDIMTPRKLKDIFLIAQSLDPQYCEVSRYLKCYPNYESFIDNLKNFRVCANPIRKALGLDEYFHRVVVKNGIIQHYSFDILYEFLNNMACVVQGISKFPLKDKNQAVVDTTYVIINIERKKENEEKRKNLL